MLDTRLAMKTANPAFVGARVAPSGCVDERRRTSMITAITLGSRLRPKLLNRLTATMFGACAVRQAIN